MKKIAILGSTGSIGTQTLEVVRANGDIQVLALSAGRNICVLEEQIREFSPKLAAVWDKDAAMELAVKVADTDTKVISGMEGLMELARMEEVEILVEVVLGAEAQVVVPAEMVTLLLVKLLHIQEELTIMIVMELLLLVAEDLVRRLKLLRLKKMEDLIQST